MDQKSKNFLNGFSVELGNYIVHVSAARARGERQTQQDEFLVLSTEKYLFVGIFDGHGTNGGKVSNFVREQVEKVAIEKLDLFQDITKALEEICKSVSDALDSTEIDSYLSGTTAVLALVNSSCIYVANIGDSGARVCTLNSINFESSIETSRGNLGINRLTKDHTCENESERCRVESTEARIEKSEENAPLRIYKGTLPYPGLVVTRSFGDQAARPLGVLCTPETSTYSLCSETKCLILASDGVWDGLQNIEILQSLRTFLKKTSSSRAEKAAKTLCSFALEGLNAKDLSDNVSLVICFFEEK